MKIFFVDKYNNFNKLIKYIHDNGIESIERKEDLKFRMTKNDYVIMPDENPFEGLDKCKNIIMLASSKEYKHIWKLVNSYKTLDVISEDMPNEYILGRIKRLVVTEE